MAQRLAGQSARHSRRGLLVALAGGLLPTARPTAAKKPKKGKSKKKFKTITKRFTLSGPEPSGPAGSSRRLAIENDVPAGKIVSIAVTLSGLFADRGSDLNLAKRTELADDSIVARGMLLSDAGAGGPIAGATITIASTATRRPPRTGQLTSGTYQATNFDEGDPDENEVPRSPDGFRQLLATSPQDEWWISIYNEGVGNIVIGAITLTIKVKVRR